MKNIKRIAGFSLLLMLLTACPTDLDYALEAKNTHKIDTNLLGTWSCNDSAELILRVTFKKKTDYLYAISVLETSDLYTQSSTEFTGWIAKVNDQRFLVVSDNENYGFYHYTIVQLTNNHLAVADLSLLDGGIDAVISTAALREQVTKSMKRFEFTEAQTTYSKN